MSVLKIENLISLDSNGFPVAPSVTQILDKDVLALWSSDTSKNKEMYVKWAGVIYYLADPRSPARQQGLNDEETLKDAIEQFNLPSTFRPSPLMIKIEKRYRDRSIGPAGLALENVYRSLNTINNIINRSHEVLSNMLNNSIGQEDTAAIIQHITTIMNLGKQIPDFMKVINKAKETVKDEEELGIVRGGGEMSASMNSDNSM